MDTVFFCQHCNDRFLYLGFYCFMYSQEDFMYNTLGNNSKVFTCFILQDPNQARLIFHLSVAESAEALDTFFPGLFSLNVCWSAVCKAAAVTVLTISWYWHWQQWKSVHFPLCQVNTALLLAQRVWSLITQRLQLYMALHSKTKQSGQMKCIFVLQINEVSGAVLILDRQMY